MYLPLDMEHVFIPDFHQRLGRGHEQGMEGGEGSPEVSGWKYLFYVRGTSQPAPRIFSPALELPSQSLKIKTQINKIWDLYVYRRVLS